MKSGEYVISVETRKRMSEAQRLRFQRPEELKKLEYARSLQDIDFEKRAEMMHEAFLKKYGSFLELAKMGMRVPKRKPSSLELKVAKSLGSEWVYVGDGKLTIGGLVPDFVHKTKRKVLEVLGCYFHSCPAHFPEVKRPRSASPAYKESVYKQNGYEVIFVWEHDMKGKARKLAFADNGVEDPSIYAKP